MLYVFSFYGYLREPLLVFRYFRVKKEQKRKKKEKHQVIHRQLIHLTGHLPSLEKGYEGESKARANSLFQNFNILHNYYKQAKSLNKVLHVFSF